MRYLSILTLLMIVFSCTKDKVPIEEPLPIAERITGSYKVYDTLGVYLYSMSLTYKQRSDYKDSLLIENIDNDFYYKESQPYIEDNFVNEKLLLFSSPFPTKDKNNKSWTLFNSSSGGIYDNKWRNDTIRMCFRKHNTPWWPSESVPYLDTIIKQLAVKQH